MSRCTVMKGTGYEAVRCMLSANHHEEHVFETLDESSTDVPPSAKSHGAQYQQHPPEPSWRDGYKCQKTLRGNRCIYAQGHHGPCDFGGSTEPKPERCDFYRGVGHNSRRCLLAMGHKDLHVLEVPDVQVPSRFTPNETSSRVACEAAMNEWIACVKEMGFYEMVDACQPVQVWRKAWQAAFKHFNELEGKER